ncbi:hypothetical protein HKD37_14G039458 [Glycine soja]
MAKLRDTVRLMMKGVMSSRVSKRIKEQESCQDLFESKREKRFLKGIPRLKEVFTKYKAKTRKRASNHWAIRVGVWSSRSQGSKISGLSTISDKTSQNQFDFEQ